MAKRRRILKLIMVVGGAAALALTVVIIASLLPTRVRSIDEAHRPFTFRGDRPAKSGCGLNEQERGADCVAAKADHIDDEEVKLASSHPERGLAELNGTLSIPRGLTGKRPAVLLVHGSGPQTRDATSEGDLVVRHEPFAVLRALAELLAKQGLVVLRYDKRACVKCYPDHEMDFKSFRFEHFVDDALDALSYLEKRSEVDSNALVVIGHSQGGQLAPLIAKQHGRLAAVVMLAGTIQTFEAGLLGQLERLADVRMGQLDAMGALAIRYQAGDYAECFEKLRSDYRADEVCIGGGVTQAALKDGEAMARSTLPTLEQLQAPVLALQGTVDINIDPRTPSMLRDALAKRDFELHYLAGVGHSLTNAYSSEPSLSAQVAKVISEFLSSVQKPRPVTEKEGDD